MKTRSPWGASGLARRVPLRFVELLTTHSQSTPPAAVSCRPMPRAMSLSPSRSPSPAPSLSGAGPKDILALARQMNVRFMRLQFTDILGVNKNVEIPTSQFEKALSGDIMFDGSSIEGFVRIEESDMLLAPDFDTFRIFPWTDPDNRICRLICDINRPDGSPFEGDPRTVLRSVIARASTM